MKILSAIQIRQADNYTIKNEPISSLALMERAGKKCFDWIVNKTDTTKKYIIICGTGNNGGDGLVIAKLLSDNQYNVEVIILSSSQEYSDDFKNNFESIKKTDIQFKLIGEGENFSLHQPAIIIDAIVGTGLSRPVSGWLGRCIDEINNSGNDIISIDIPSGLYADQSSDGEIIKANHTLTFQFPKLAFFFQENEKYVGEFYVLDIGLDKKFIKEINSLKFYLCKKDIKKILKPRSKFSHKGNHGHSFLICGSKGKIGAAVLSAGACLRSGTGLLTIHIPGCGNEILQTALPEAMVALDDSNDIITKVGDTGNYNGIGIGPGIGNSDETKKMFFDFLENVKKPIVIDADALNILSEHPERLKTIPPHSILTPHPKEFERLAGKSLNNFERHKQQIRFSIEHNVIVVLKGAHTCISLSDGKVFFNSTGNPGMAKGGSGDALTGMITAFLSQNYKPEHAALLGVYLHGAAGDIAAKKKGIYSMICTDLIEFIPKAFLNLI